MTSHKLQVNTFEDGGKVSQPWGFLHLCPSMLLLLSWLWGWSRLIFTEAASMNKISCRNYHPYFLQLLKIALQFYKYVNHDPTEFLWYVSSYLFRARLLHEDTIGKFFEKIIFLEFSVATIKSLNFYVLFFLLLCFINKHDTLFYKVISFWVIEPQKKHIKPTNLIIFGFLKLKIDSNQVQLAIFPPCLRNYILGFRLK